MSGPISATLADELATLKRHVAVLSIARKLDDHVAAFVAATHASATCRQLTRRVTDRAVVDSDLATTIDVAITHSRALIESHPRYLLAADCDRMIRWMAASDYLDCGDPDLFEIEVRDLELRSFDLTRLKVARSRFTCISLRESVFDGAWFEDCDLSRSNLQRASMRGAAFVRCSLNGSSLVDATLDDATFVDCELRGAELGPTRTSGRGSAFIRCDLRSSYWHERPLSGMRFDRCKLFGAHGRPVVEGVEIELPDLSVDGDGSRIGTARDVLRQWFDSGSTRRALYLVAR